MPPRTRDEVIAGLKGLGVTEAEIAELLAQEVAANPASTAEPARPKLRYRVRNWRAYNQALIQRGSLTIWFEEATLQAWLGNERAGAVGAPTTYADLAIVCMLTLKAVFHLPLRQTQGLVASVLLLLGVPLPIPHYSTLCRRSATVQVPRLRQQRAQHLHLVVDSSGLKIYGDGEWQVRQHGATRRRGWRKLHLGVDEASGEIVAQVLTREHVGDHEVMPQLVRQIPGRIHQCSGDGGYDYDVVYRTFARRTTRVTIRPRSNAARSPDGWKAQRNAHITRIEEVGRAQWKVECGYHRRSLAETAVFRMKTIFGDRLRARSIRRQQSEAAIRCAALNRMTRLGMPDSYPVIAG
jgi:IS5 family transposase